MEQVREREAICRGVVEVERKQDTSKETVKVAVIISTHNRKELLKRSLDSLFNSFDKIKPMKIIVYDDGSDDGTKEFLDDLHEKIEGISTYFILGEENLGLRETLNNLLNETYKLNPDYICYCQDDIEYEKGWLDKCIDNWEREGIGFITGHDAPEHPVKEGGFIQTDDYDGYKYYIKNTCRATHLFASTERWKEFGEIPDLTPGIPAPKPGHGSMVDWWLIGHPEGVFPESEHSLKKKGEKVLCIPGLIRHIGTEPKDSTWYNKTFERGRLTPNRIGVQIITRNRPEYLSTLLASLREQTIQNFDLYMVDNSDTPVTDSHQVRALLERMQFEGHRAYLARHPARDIGFLRNLALDMDTNEFGVRIDDDSICDKHYLERLIKVFYKEDNVGCVGGIVPFIHAEKDYHPIPERFNEMTKWFDMRDDAIWFYNTKKHYPADHIRSSMMYRNEIAKKIRHPEGFGKTGWREETVFSYRFKIHGYENYMVPGAMCWHFGAPSGGGRDIGDDPNKIWFDNDQKMKEVLSNEIQTATQSKGL